MLRNIVSFVASVIIGYLSAYLLDLAIAHYQLWKAENRWENALHDLRQQRRTTT